MYTLLTLFFISLVGIIFMVSRKLALVKSGRIVPTENMGPMVPDLETIKYTVSNGAKKSGYVALVGILRLYVQTGNFLKNQYAKLETSIKNRLKSRTKDEVTGEYRESKFLKVVTDYKHKVRSIKNKIVTEEERKL